MHMNNYLINKPTEVNLQIIRIRKPGPSEITTIKCEDLYQPTNNY
jgi:hypothetical protein